MAKTASQFSLYPGCQVSDRELCLPGQEATHTTEFSHSPTDASEAEETFLHGEIAGIWYVLKDLDHGGCDVSPHSTVFGIVQSGFRAFRGLAKDESDAVSLSHQLGEFFKTSGLVLAGTVPNDEILQRRVLLVCAERESQPFADLTAGKSQREHVLT